MPSLANSGYFLAIFSDPKVFSNGNIVSDDQKEFDAPQVSDDLKIISNERIWTLMIQRNSIIPMYSMIRRGF